MGWIFLNALPVVFGVAANAADFTPTLPQQASFPIVARLEAENIRTHRRATVIFHSDAELPVQTDTLYTIDQLYTDGEPESPTFPVFPCFGTERSIKTSRGRMLLTVEQCTWASGSVVSGYAKFKSGETLAIRGCADGTLPSALPWSIDTRVDVLDGRWFLRLACESK
jgi:hypothetical protein